MKKNLGCVRMEPMSPEQQKKIRETARAMGLREYALISVGLSHALRASEFCQLRVEDIDLRENTITVRRLKNSLTTTERLLPSEIEVLRELIAGKSPTDRVFPFSRHTAYRLFRKCAETAGLPKSCRGIHSAKHTVLQTCCDAGMSLPQLMRVGGHRSYSASLRYYEAKQSQVDDLKARALTAA